MTQSNLKQIMLDCVKTTTTTTTTKRTTSLYKHSHRPHGYVKQVESHHIGGYLNCACLSLTPNNQISTDDTKNKGKEPIHGKILYNS